MANLPLNLVKKLYYKEQLSSIEIGNRLGVSPEVVLRFMKRMSLPRRTLQENNRIWFEKQPKSFSLKQNLSKEEEKLKMVGIMLYWGEGTSLTPDSGSAIVDFANSNPQMIKLFLKFLRDICRVDEARLRVLLYCYANQDVEALKRYWHKLTKIPLNQFIKPYVRQDFLPGKRGKMKHGLVHIRYCDKKLVVQIKGWLEEYLRKNNI